MVQQSMTRVCVCWCLTWCVFCVLAVPVVGAAALVQARVRGGTAVPERAIPATHCRIRRVQVLRTLEAFMVVPAGVQPAVTVLSPCTGHAQVPCEKTQKEAAYPARHTAQSLHFCAWVSQCSCVCVCVSYRLRAGLWSKVHSCLQVSYHLDLEIWNNVALFLPSLQHMMLSYPALQTQTVRHTHY